MDTNRKLLLKACVATMVFLATGASAQTIYKQVDEEGRVVFTDQPKASARTVASFESSRPRAQAVADVDNGSRIAPEPARRVVAQAAVSEAAETVPRYDAEAMPRNGYGADALPRTAVDPSIPAGTSRGRGDVERAVFSYATLNTPLAAQVDATEAARRARQASRKDDGKMVLVVQATPHDHAPTAKPDLSAAYIAWAVTFFLLAGGLLYVGWQVFRLILGRAFPRWELGLA